MSFNIPYSDFLNSGLNQSGLSPRGSIAQNVNVTDLVCEGPIRGLVNGAAGVHLDDVSVEDANFRSFTSYQPSGDNQQTFSGDITFSGTAVGTLSDELDISELELDENSPRSITLQNYKTTSVTVSSSTENNGATTLSLSASSGSPFTSDWNSGQQLSDKAFSIVSLIQDDFSVIGFFTVISGSTASFISYGVIPPTTGTFTLVVDYTIPLTAVDSANNQLTLAATPASASYKFIIGAQTALSDNGEVSAGLSSVVEKIHKLNIDFRKGDLYQPVTTSTGGVGGAVAVTGNTSLISGPTELKIIKQSLADSLGVDILDKNGLPNIDGSKAFPGTPDFDVMAEFVTTLPSSSFGLDTAVKIREADEIGFSIKYPALQVINLNKGDKETAYAFYVMQIRFEQNNSYGSWKSLFPGSKYIKHYGNTSAPVSFDHDINLDGYRNIIGDFEDFEVRVFRVTRHLGLPVRSSGTNEDDTNKKKWQLAASATIDNLRAVIKDHFTYPYSAVASVSFSSRQFDGVPKRSYLLEGKLVKVPSTYTPREYSDTGIAKYEGFWDGEFRDTLFYTDNPAWVFYDIVTNNRYGAGKWLEESDIDKYALYRVARYCDELVDDGSEYDSESPLVIGEFYRIKTAGTTTWTNLGAADNNVDTIFRATSTTITGTGVACRVEPRFRANVFLTKATDVYKVLKDFATIFLGILYWQDSKVVAVQDAPQDPIYNFTKGNVIDGAFSYESSGSRTRTNQVVVTWNDPTINYQPVPLVVEDRESIVRSGRIISENVVAFGATSESQAIRYGRWKLWTAQNQTEIISFKTSLAAHYIKPGDVINVQDADRFGIAYSGRTSSATSNTITFDRNVSFNSGSTYNLSTLVTAPAALNASDGSITVNSVTYERGERIDQAYVYDGSTYELVDLDTEERASNAFTDSSGTELIPTIWKPYSYVETHEITNPGSTTNTVTLANSATFDTTPSKHNIWTLKETSGNLNVAGSQKMYKVLSIAEESPNIFGVSAVEYYDEKFTAIEEDYDLGTTPGTIYDEVEPVRIPAPTNLRVILATDAKKAGEEFILEWDQEDSDLISQYEVIHNIEGLESPIKTASRQVAFDNVPNGSVNLKVRGVSRKGNVSSFIGINYGVYDPYGTNVERVQYGIPKGVVSSSEAGITGSSGSESYTFLDSSYAITSNGDKETVVNPNENSQDVSDISADENYYVFLDADTPTLKLMYYDTESLENMPFWRDVGTGNSASSTSWTSIGSVSINANSNRVTGSGFNTNVKLRDILNLSGSTAPTTPVGEGAIVVSIVSDTELIIDRTFDSAITSTTAYRANYRPDYVADAAIAVVSKNSSNVFTSENFLTIDPKLAGSRSFTLDIDTQNLTYDSSSAQTNTPSSINATVSTVGYKEPEFKIVIPAGMSAAGTQNFAVSTESNSLNKTFVLDNDGAIDYSSGAPLTITASVREKNNPDNTVLSFSKTITKTKDGTDGIDATGADGEDGRVVNLTMGDQTFEYDTSGATPSPTSTTVTATALNTTGTVYYEFLVNDTTVQGPNSTSSTYTYTPPSSYADMPQKIEVRIREGSSTSTPVARDQITASGLKAGTDAITVILSNEAHTLNTTTAGVVTYTDSGTDIEVWEGTSAVPYDDSAPYATPSYRVSASGSSITPSSPSTVSTYIRRYPDHSNMTANNASITYTITVVNSAGSEVSFTKTQSFSKSIQGDTGTGTQGNRGEKVITGYLYYYVAQSSAPTVPATSILSVNWSTGAVSSSDSNWDIQPPTFDAGSTNTYWYFTFTAAESGTYNSGTDSYSGTTVTFNPASSSNAVKGIGFQNLVTFSSLTAQGTTTIDGSRITTGQIDAQRLNVGQINVGDLVNDANYQTQAITSSAQINVTQTTNYVAPPTQVGQLTNDAGYQTQAFTQPGQINVAQTTNYVAPPTQVGQLTNDSNFQSGLTDLSQFSNATTQFQTGLAQLSQFTNDSGFQTAAFTQPGQINVTQTTNYVAPPTQVGQLNNDSGFQTQAVELSATAISGGKIGLSTVGLVLGDSQVSITAQNSIILDTTQGNNAISVYDGTTLRVKIGKL